MQRFVLLLLNLICLAGCSPETIQRSDKPLSRAEAVEKVSFPFPASAKDICFLMHADGLQESQVFVRFTVDAAELEPTVNSLLAGHSTGEELEYDPNLVELKQFLPMPWWTPQAIINGHHRTGGRPPIYVWSDTDQHTLFVCTTD